MNINVALASILSAAMMLHHLNLHIEAQAIEKAVEKSLELHITTADINPKNPFTTTKVGDFIADYINDTNINYKMCIWGKVRLFDSYPSFKKTELK